MPWIVAALVITGVFGFTVRERLRSPVPVTLLAEIVTELRPTVVGVPEMMPVAVLRSRPAGNPVALKLDGVLSAMIV